MERMNNARFWIDLARILKQKANGKTSTGHYPDWDVTCTLELLSESITEALKTNCYPYE